MNKVNIYITENGSDIKGPFAYVLAAICSAVETINESRPGAKELVIHALQESLKWEQDESAN